MSEGKIIEIYNQGISQVIDTIKMVSNQIKEQNSKIDKLSKDNKALNQRVKSLESQINKNSNNSSKPPSSDGFKNKTKSLRQNQVKNLAFKNVMKEQHCAKMIILMELKFIRQNNVLNAEHP